MCDYEKYGDCHDVHLRCDQCPMRGKPGPSEPSPPADRREIVARINAAIAKLTFMTHGKIGLDWRSSRQFVLPEKGNEWDALLDAIELLRDARSAILAALDK